MNPSTKPFLTYDSQLDKLANEKQLIISDYEKALQILKDIGYFSLIGGYKTPLINPMTRIYQNKTMFEDIYALYQFDQSLRELVFRYLCKIEQKMRQLISYNFSKVHGEQQTKYLNPVNYDSSPKNKSSIYKLIEILKYQALRNTDHPYILHQRSLYHNVPLWVLINTLTYGQISHFYSLLPYNLKSTISKEFPFVKERELEKYLKIFTLFRNVCAHNERLYSFRTQIDFPDTELHAKLNISKQGKQYIQGKRDFFGLVIALRYMLPKESFQEFKHALHKLVQRYYHQSQTISEDTLLSMMGFPKNWASIMRYQLHITGFHSKKT